MWSICRPAVVSASRRSLVRFASSSLRMPAMSPTMTEGGIAGWKLAEGEAFAAGDILLEIETDKATIDVEAQDDGIMGKILSQAGSQKIPVGQIIAVLAEEGDDLSTLEIPGDLSPPSSASTSGQPEPEKKDQSMTEKKELASTPSASSSSSSTPPSTQDSSASPKSGTPTPESQRQNAPQSGRETETKAEKIQKGGVPVDVGGHKGNVHGGASGRPLFPSVMRLLAEADLTPDQISAIKGTGRNRMLTKGDVLAALGKISDAKGSMKGIPKTAYATSAGYGDNGTSTGAGAGPGATAQKPTKPMTPLQLRQAILNGLEKASLPARPLSAATSPLSASSTLEHDFDQLLESYGSLFSTERKPSGVSIPSDIGLDIQQGGSSAAAGKKDEWEGLF
ncbi:hypothetical protein FFLO_05497 [Filobasidium floriforme]|uniref:Pyruvate dehydrogenase X component n=1 Tax=Filobasidium floriforme TaxID=5210 RepID=A0A8K0NRB8_9TREE|nr:hypothetical protein FFLO_05497 [Filobasidium floriforme]